MFGRSETQNSHAFFSFPISFFSELLGFLEVQIEHLPPMLGIAVYLAAVEFISLLLYKL